MLTEASSAAASASASESAACAQGARCLCLTMRVRKDKEEVVAGDKGGQIKGRRKSEGQIEDRYRPRQQR
eukprot:146576-Rhodomonas_salina.2